MAQFPRFDGKNFVEYWDLIGDRWLVLLGADSKGFQSLVLDPADAGHLHAVQSSDDVVMRYMKAASGLVTALLQRTLVDLVAPLVAKELKASDSEARAAVAVMVFGDPTFVRALEGDLTGLYRAKGQDFHAVAMALRPSESYKAIRSASERVFPDNARRHLARTIAEATRRVRSTLAE